MAFKKTTLFTMSLRFRGGERLQRGRGIGGILRLIKSVFSPVVRSLGKTAVKVATSGAAKTVGNALKEQALTSAVNLGIDAIRGNNLQESLEREVGSARHKAADTLEGIRNSQRRKPVTKVKRVARKKAAQKYSDAYARDLLS